MFLVPVLRSGKIHRFEKGKSVSLQVVFWPLSLDKIQRNGVTLLHATSSVVLRRTSALSSIPEPNDNSNFFILIWKWWVVSCEPLACFTYMRVCYVYRKYLPLSNIPFFSNFIPFWNFWRINTITALQIRFIIQVSSIFFLDFRFTFQFYWNLARTLSIFDFLSFYFPPKIDRRDMSSWFKTILISRELLQYINCYRLIQKR